MGALLLAAIPLTALAQGAAPAACPATKAHTLPKGSGSTAVFSFGVKGGSLRPWSIKLVLDGSITSDGASTSRQQLHDPKNSLAGLLALADVEGFFSMKKTVGCLGSAGNPDTSSHFISIHTSSGTKRVNEYGSCAGTAKFDQLWAVLQEAAGIQ